MKRLKSRVLQRLIDAHKCAACLLATSLFLRGTKIRQAHRQGMQA